MAATKIFAFWDSSPAASEHQAELCALWHRSWTARGWMPRLLTVRDAMRSSRYKAMEKRGEAIRPELLPDFAVHYVGGGGHIFLCPLHVINFSLLPPGKNFFAQVEFYKYPGWLSAPVVDFDRGADPKTILECGRAI